MEGRKRMKGRAERGKEGRKEKNERTDGWKEEMNNVKE